MGTFGALKHIFFGSTNPTEQRQNAALHSCCSSPLQRASIASEGAPRGLGADINWSDSSTPAGGRGQRGRKKQRRTYRTASSIYVHTAKSTTALHIGRFYHFGWLAGAPLEAINFKPQSLLPVLHLTFPPLLKEGRVEEKGGGGGHRVTYCFYMKSIPLVFGSIMT